MLAARTVALNPVRARLVQRPQDWAWSSLRAHLDGRDDGLVTVALARLRAAVTTGRPLGSDNFVTWLEDLMRHRLRRQKPGRKAKVPESASDLFVGMSRKSAQTGNMSGVTVIPALPRPWNEVAEHAPDPG